MGIWSHSAVAEHTIPILSFPLPRGSPWTEQKDSRTNAWEVQARDGSLLPGSASSSEVMHLNYREYEILVINRMKPVLSDHPRGQQNFYTLDIGPKSTLSYAGRTPTGVNGNCICATESKIGQWSIFEVILEMLRMLYTGCLVPSAGFTVLAHTLSKRCGRL